MVAVEQYGQYLWRVAGEAAGHDAAGNLVQGVPGEAVFVSRCRLERGGSATEAGNGDGLVTRWGGTVYAPRGVLGVMPGDVLRVSADGAGTEVLAVVEAVGCDRGALHNRIYVK